MLFALELARVIAGETPGCSVEAKLAVAHVAANRVEQGIVEHPLDGWFGDADPEPIDFLVALYWHKLPDPTGGAIWMIGPGDNLPWKKTRTGRWECPATWVESWTVIDRDTVRQALLTALPEDTPGDVVESATVAVLALIKREEEYDGIVQGTSVWEAIPDHSRLG